MGTKINQDAYDKLIKYDMEWLEKQEHSCEKLHIEAILKWASYNAYDKVPIDKTRQYLTEEFGKEVGDRFYYAAINGMLD